MNKEILRSERKALVEALEQVGAKFKGNTCKCPFHEDHRPSAGIFERDGVWRFKCLACGAGGDVFDMRAKIDGTTPAEQLKKLAGPKQNKRQAKQGFANLDAVRDYLRGAVGNIESEHQYKTAEGDLVHYVFRCLIRNGKQFRPVTLSDSGYILKMPPKPWLLYNLQDVVKAESVIIVEGEKGADCLKRYGFTGTTSPDGALNAKHTNWTSLSGKTVIMWRDNDTQGKRYEMDVQEILQELDPAPRIYVIDPAELDLADGEDVFDFIEQLKVLGKTDAEIITAIETVLKNAKPLSLSNQVRQRIADICAGRYYAVPLPWDMMYNLTKALLPNTVTKFVGTSGATKTFSTMQLFANCMSLGIKTALFELEEDMTYHLTRALAQQTCCAGLTDADWVKENNKLADELAQENAGFLNDFGRVLYSMPNGQVSLEYLAEWIEQQAKRGCRVIGIDPVTAASRKGEAWTADEKFLHSIKRTATDYKCSVILVSHPVKNVTFPDMGQIAGGATYNRFCQTIIWLEMHEEKTSRVRTCCGTDDISHNRTLYILKARNGKGGGHKIAFNFDSESLTLKELGLIVKVKK